MPTLAEGLADWKPGRLRVLIVGGGIAGLTSAAWLQRQDVRPVVIDRAANFQEAGYSIGLYPIGSRVLYGLGVHDRFMDVSVNYDFYELHDGAGKPIKQYDMRGIFDAIGPFRGLRRSETLAILQQANGDLPIHFETSVDHFTQDDTGVDVTFHDGSQARFDLVIGADGIHSDTRAQLLEKNEYEMFDSGWGTWVVWTKQPLAPAGTVREFWGVGNFLGIYPVKDELMICLGGPKRIALDQTLGSPTDRARKLFSAMDPTIAQPVLAELQKTEKPFFWDLHDYRSKAWYRGRVVLVGDAAAGFLPTAGIGASMALNGAASLADELSRTDAKYVGAALKAYERRQKARTEKAQTLSRELGKFMLMDSKPLSWLRDEFSKAYTVHQFAHDTMALMEAEIS